MPCVNVTIQGGSSSGGSDGTGGTGGSGSGGDSGGTGGTGGGGSGGTGGTGGSGSGGVQIPFGLTTTQAGLIGGGLVGAALLATQLGGDSGQGRYAYRRPLPTRRNNTGGNQ